MTTETDLLPLPEPNGSYTNPYDGDDLENYARANVAHAVATLQAEVEALRAEVGGLRSLAAAAYQAAGAHDWPQAWLDALSNAASELPFSTDGLLPMATPDYLARAERWGGCCLVCRDRGRSIVQ